MILTDVCADCASLKAAEINCEQHGGECVSGYRGDDLKHNLKTTRACFNFFRVALYKSVER